MTAFLLILGLAFAPGIFWMWIFYRRDRLEPEPSSFIVKTYLLGILAALPVALLETPFIFCASILAVFIAPVIEEYFKFLIVRYGVYRHREFDEPMDGIVYAAAAALGFASIENFFYLLSAWMTGNFVAVMAFRALLTVPGHALWSSMWGYTLGLAKFSPPEVRTRINVRGLVLAMVCHSFFNFLLIFSVVGALAVLIFILFLWGLLRRRIAVLLQLSPHGRVEGTGSDPTD